jgi:hypothetical protein
MAARNEQRRTMFTSCQVQQNGVPAARSTGGALTGIEALEALHKTISLVPCYNSAAGPQLLSQQRSKAGVSTVPKRTLNRVLLRKSYTAMVR